jgi:poly(3-hydroxybutyrate) depolymerase
MRCDLQAMERYMATGIPSRWGCPGASARGCYAIHLEKNSPIPLLRVKGKLIMNRKNTYQIAISILLILLFLPSCGTNDQGFSNTPFSQEVKQGGDEESKNADVDETGRATEPIATQEDLQNTFRVETGNLDYEGEQRNYMVVVPKDYVDDAEIPLIIYLHSHGWTAQQGMDYTLIHQAANTFGFLVAYPSAANNWNSGIGENPGWPTPNVNDVEFINTLIDTLSDNYNINLERIYAAGYSNGGFMAYKLACQLSERIAAIASVGGLISENTLAECNPSRPVPILHIHGTDDSWVPMEGGTGWQSVEQSLGYWIEFNRCENTSSINLEDLDPSDDCTVEMISYSGCADDSEVVYYKVIDGGHTWPGAGSAGYPAGNTTQDINASLVISSFFMDH